MMTLSGVRSLVAHESVRKSRLRRVGALGLRLRFLPAPPAPLRTRDIAHDSATTVTSRCRRGPGGVPVNGWQRISSHRKLDSAALSREIAGHPCARETFDRSRIVVRERIAQARKG